MKDKETKKVRSIVSYSKRWEDYWAERDAQIARANKALKDLEKSFADNPDPMLVSLQKVWSKPLIILGGVGLILSIVFHIMFIKHMIELPNSISPNNPFPNPYTVDSAIIPLGFLMGFSAVGLYKGIDFTGKTRLTDAEYLILIPLLVPLILSLSIVSPVSDSTTDSLLEVQHSWANERYGISYDSITTYTTGSKPIRTWQNKFMLGNKIVAQVCEIEMGDVVLCFPNSLKELPLISER